LKEEELTYTYTYTARNRENPEHAATFTIVDDHLRVNLTGLDDQISQMLSGSQEINPIKQFLTTQAGTTLYKIIESMSGPVHIKDVAANLTGDQLNLVIWKRVGGLRFAPMNILFQQVDNTEAAALFLEALTERQAETDSPAILPGLMDYWATWLGVLLGMIMLINKIRQRKSKA
jgi:hypothetical protein